MEVKADALKASRFLLMLSALVFRAKSASPATSGTLLITRHNNGDIFLQPTDPSTKCTEETCLGLSSGTATAISKREMCTCRCLPHLPAFREDLRICLDDIHECVLAPFVGGSTYQHIPFVYLPLKGQIIHPGKEISFTGLHTPVCAISGAKYMTEDGWVDLRDPVDSDVPFRLFREEGRAFLQWAGNADMRNKMSGRLVMVYLMCREVATTEQDENQEVQTLFSPCVAFRVVGTPSKHISNVSEIAFIPDAHAATNPADASRMTISEYVAIGICSILLGLIYVASVFLFLHLRKRNKSSSPSDAAGLDGRSLQNVEEGIVKNNPLLSISPRFIPSEISYSDTNSSDNEAAPDIIKHHEERQKHQIISAMVHPPRSQHSTNARRSPFSLLEYSHQDSATNEKLPEENVSIVETLELREERPDNVRALTGITRKKLYFNPAYFEPQLLVTPPPAALEFLSKIREVISTAKQKMAAKRFSPSLLNIPEEENQYALDHPFYEYGTNAVSRRNSNISLKRENSRRNKTCTGCPGCEPQNFNTFNGTLPEFPLLAACNNCTLTSNDIKQRSIRKWLEDVPILKETNHSRPNDDGIKPQRVRSPTSSLLPEKVEVPNRALSPKPVSEKSSKLQDLEGKNSIHKLIRSPTAPVFKELTKEQNVYDTIPTDTPQGTPIHFPPPDMIHEAMEVDRSEEKVATLTKEQMNAVINEFTVHRSLIIAQEDIPVAPKKESDIEYEADSLERTGNKGYSTPSDYAAVSSSQPSPSLSAALPNQEEMTIRNAIFNKITGNMTISTMNSDVVQEDDHDYELIVMKKGSVSERCSFNLPELLQRNHGYSLVSEVYVNNGYNYSSIPSTPGGSVYSTLDKKSLKVQYGEGTEKPGKLLIEVEDCPDNYIPVHDSDNFEPDTLDRKPSKMKMNRPVLKPDNEYDDSLERPNQILLRTTGSFRSDALSSGKKANAQPSNFNRVFGSLREIYEAKNKRLVPKQIDADTCSLVGGDEKGRILTLEERHCKRQRAKGNLVQPDVIPPPPHHGSPVYEYPKSPGKVLSNETSSMKRQLSQKNANGRSVGNYPSSTAPINDNQLHVPSGAPDQHKEDYELCLLRKSKKNGNITSIIQTEDIILKRGSNDQFVLRSAVYPFKSVIAEAKTQRCTWQNNFKPEDSGYLSSDSNESRLVANQGIVVDPAGIGSETDESLGDGHSESGAESVETHSVFFGRYHRNSVKIGGYGSMDSGVIGGEEGVSSSDSETVSYTTVVPVTGPTGPT